MSVNLPKVPAVVWTWLAVAVVAALVFAYFRKQAEDLGDAATDAINVGSSTNLASRAANAIVGGATSADDGVADSVGTWFYGLLNENDGYNANPNVTARDRP